jgi:hypothetical protein
MFTFVYFFHLVLTLAVLHRASFLYSPPFAINQESYCSMYYTAADYQFEICRSITVYSGLVTTWVRTYIALSLQSAMKVDCSKSTTRRLKVIVCPCVHNEAISPGWNLDYCFLSTSNFSLIIYVLMSLKFSGMHLSLVMY